MRYRKSSSPTSGFDTIVMEMRETSSISQKHSFVHVKLCIQHGTLKKDKQHSTDREMNQLSTATHLIGCCTYFLEVKCRMLKIA